VGISRELSLIVVGSEVLCAVCGRCKAPRGRDIPLERFSDLCVVDCPGYNQDPLQGDLWPGELRSQAKHDKLRVEIAECVTQRDELAARLAAVGEAVADNGCNCDCDCSMNHERHNDNCDPCWSCVISDILERKK